MTKDQHQLTNNNNNLNHLLSSILKKQISLVQNNKIIRCTRNQIFSYTRASIFCLKKVHKYKLDIAPEEHYDRAWSTVLRIGCDATTVARVRKFHATFEFKLKNVMITKITNTFSTFCLSQKCVYKRLRSTFSSVPDQSFKKIDVF